MDKEQNADEAVSDAIEAIASGQFIAVSDSDDREDEADLIIAAEFIAVEQMAFLIRHTSGIICTPITQQRAEQLGLGRLQSANPSHFDTPFAMPVDYLPGSRGGVSAEERTATVHAIVDQKTDPSNLGRPGHVFPLIAAEGGLMERSGHTEAAMALMVAAQLQPVSVIGELMNEDGTMMRGEGLHTFLKNESIQHITIEQLSEYITSRGLARNEKKEYKL